MREWERINEREWEGNGKERREGKRTYHHLVRTQAPRCADDKTQGKTRRKINETEEEARTRLSNPYGKLWTFSLLWRCNVTLA